MRKDKYTPIRDFFKVILYFTALTFITFAVSQILPLFSIVVFIYGFIIAGEQYEKFMLKYFP